MQKNGTEEPKFWSDIMELYDDGKFKAIWGEFKDFGARSLGIRWNDSGETTSCPVSRNGEKLYLVVPAFLIETVLQKLHDEVTGGASGCLEHIDTALNEFREEQTREHQTNKGVITNASR